MPQQLPSDAQPEQPPLVIGASVLIHNLSDTGTKYEGCIGTYVGINEHNGDGDFYGVQFFGDTNHTIYFFRQEITVLTPEQVEQDKRAREADEKDMQGIAQEWRDYRNEGLGTAG